MEDDGWLRTGWPEEYEDVKTGKERDCYALKHISLYSILKNL
jgi:hypothetical protein